MASLDRWLGCLLGSAAADACGTTAETLVPGSFDKITTIRGGGKFNLAPGEWTDDTSMALCLAGSILGLGGQLDGCDQLRQYMNWFENGWMSSNGRCFDVGSVLTCSCPLVQQMHAEGPVEASSGTQESCVWRHGGQCIGERLCHETGPDSDAGGHCCMISMRRQTALGPQWITDGMEGAEQSSVTTHGGRAGVDSCRFWSILVSEALRGESKEALVAPHPGLGLHPEVEEIANGGWRQCEWPADPEKIQNGGYAVDTIRAALYFFAHTASYEEAILACVNLGGDADTVACVLGQLAGAHYGVAGIPVEWPIACRGLLESASQGLFRLATVRSERMIAGFPAIETDLGGWEGVLEEYRQAESEYVQVIIRKLNPGPRMYRDLETFDEDARVLLSHCGDVFRGEYARRIAFERGELSNRIAARSH